MDNYFPDYWGSFLKKSVDDEKQIDYWSRIVGSGIKEFEELTSLFLRTCGVNTVCENNPDNLDMWKNVQEELKRSFKDYVNFLGFIPRDEYLELIKEKNELKGNLDAREETIQQLRELLVEAQEARHAEVTRQFEQLLEKQKEQVRILEAGELFQTETSKQVEALLKKQSEQIQKLEAREAAQAETVKQFEALLKKQSEQVQKLKAKEINHPEIARQIDELLKKQNEQFEKLLESIREVLRTESRANEG